ncbi:MAG TPA: hypothetical protein ENJ38_11205 [Rhodospirillales bacterium]|nr:hypothetical protein [Rhodospirillales bacterium]
MIGIDLFPADRRQVLQDHARLPVLPRTPATFWERAELAFRESFRTETSIGVEWMYYRRWEKALDALEEKTGEALVNPFALRGPTRREALDRARRKLLEARAEHPDLPDPDSFDADIRREVGALRAERGKAGEVSTPGGTLGDLAGTMAAVMTDPVNIASMAAGAPAAAGILRTALIEAGIAAASETAIQAIVAPQKKALGLEVSLGESAANVALAAAGGGILGGSVKALAKGARALLGSGRQLPLRVRDAARIVQHQEKTLDEIGDLAEGLGIDRRTAHRLHRELLPETLRAVRRGEIADVDRLLRERDDLRRAYQRVLDEPAGPADDPLVRIRPEDIEASIVARGGFKGIGDVRVKGAGWGLVKFVWRHGEKGPKPRAKQVTMEDVLRFPEVIRTRHPRTVGPQREWVVARPDGERVVYVDSPVSGREGRRVVTIHVLDDPSAKDVSPIRPVGSPGRAFAGPSGDTAAPPYGQRTTQPRESPGSRGAAPVDRRTDRSDTRAVPPDNMRTPAAPVKTDSPSAPAHRFAAAARRARAARPVLEDTDALAEQWIAEARRLVDAGDFEVELEEGRVSARDVLETLEREENALREGPIACLLGGVVGAA